MEWREEKTADCDVLSWSGGKDSFLALVALANEAARDVVLLRTYDGRSGQVARQVSFWRSLKATRVKGRDVYAGGHDKVTVGVFTNPIDGALNAIFIPVGTEAGRGGIEGLIRPIH